MAGVAHTEGKPVPPKPLQSSTALTADASVSTAAAAVASTSPTAGAATAPVSGSPRKQRSSLTVATSKASDSGAAASTDSVASAGAGAGAAAPNSYRTRVAGPIVSLGSNNNSGAYFSGASPGTGGGSGGGSSTPTTSLLSLAGSRENSIPKTVSVTETLVPSSPRIFDDETDPTNGDGPLSPAHNNSNAVVVGNKPSSAVAVSSQPKTGSAAFGPSGVAAGSGGDHKSSPHHSHAHVAHPTHMFPSGILTIPSHVAAGHPTATHHSHHNSHGQPDSVFTGTAAAHAAMAAATDLKSEKSSAAAAMQKKPHKLSKKKFTRPVEQLLHLKGTNKKLVVGMVGLPARGKTYIAKKLTRYLNWLGYQTRLFNIGEYRRKNVGAEQHAEFFDPANKQAVAVREEMAVAALTDMFKFFSEGGQAAIYDGTNSIRSRRKMVQEFIKTNSGDMTVELMWVESVCNDAKIVEENIRATKLFSPDYAHMSADAAIADFRTRIAMYEKAYETLSETHESTVPFVKLIDVGRSVISNQISGYLPGRIVFFLMNLRINKDAIFISRHGESQFNVAGKIGGDSSLTDKGRDYARALGKFMEVQPEVMRATGNGQPLSIWCSTLKRTVETVQELKNQDSAVQWRALTEIQVGICDGMTYEEIEKKYPDEFAARKADKLGYRYPQGESYIDVITRLEPVIFELERIKGPVLVVGHRAVLRCLYAYFREMAIEEIPYLEVPLHTVIKLVPKAYGCEESRFKIGIQTATDLRQDHKLT